MLLCIDTATRSTSVAICDGVVQHSAQTDGGSPGDFLAAMIDELLASNGVARADISGVAVGVGPGPFTSTRVGVATANAIGAALRIPVHGYCSLDAIAADFAHETDLLVATDARRREIYWARYHRGTRIAGPSVGQPGELVAQFLTSRWVGDGLRRYPELADSVVQELAFPRAQNFAAIARKAPGGEARSTVDLVEHGVSIPAETLVDDRVFPPVPLYLRRPDAKPARTKS